MDRKSSHCKEPAALVDQTSEAEFKAGSLDVRELRLGKDPELDSHNSL